MDNEAKEKSTPKQLCTIRIGFPVDTDEAAIDYKKKIAAVLAEIPDAQIQFSLMTARERPLPMPT